MAEYMICETSRHFKWYVLTTLNEKYKGNRKMDTYTHEVGTDSRIK